MARWRLAVVAVVAILVGLWLLQPKDTDLDHEGDHEIKRLAARNDVPLPDSTNRQLSRKRLFPRVRRVVCKILGNAPCTKAPSKAPTKATKSPVSPVPPVPSPSTPTKSRVPPIAMSEPTRSPLAPPRTAPISPHSPQSESRPAPPVTISDAERSPIVPISPQSPLSEPKPTLTPLAPNLPPVRPPTRKPVSVAPLPGLEPAATFPTYAPPRPKTTCPPSEKCAINYMSRTMGSRCTDKCVPEKYISQHQKAQWKCGGCAQPTRSPIYIPTNTDPAPPPPPRPVAAPSVPLRAPNALPPHSPTALSPSAPTALSAPTATNAPPPRMPVVSTRIPVTLTPPRISTPSPRIAVSSTPSPRANNLAPRPFPAPIPAPDTMLKLLNLELLYPIVNVLNGPASTMVQITAQGVPWGILQCQVEATNGPSGDIAWYEPPHATGTGIVSFNITLTFQPFIRGGTYALGVTLLDGSMRSLLYSSRDLETMNLPSVIQVVNAREDQSPPHLLNFSAKTSTRVDTSRRSAIVTFNIELEDTMSGVNALELRAGVEVVRQEKAIPSIVGRRVFSVDLIFPAHKPPGLYPLQLYVWDVLDNRDDFNTTRLAKLGYPSAVEIVPRI